MVWRTLQPGDTRGFPGSLYTSDAKMAELGFDPRCGTSFYDVERKVWYLLEFDGATFRRQLELGEQSLAREREAAAKPDASEYWKKSIEARAKGLENQREYGSRLYVMDVDTDRSSLERKYAGRDDIAILPGTLGCMNGSLMVRSILVDTVNVPRELRAVVEDPKGTGHRLRVLHRPVAGKTGTAQKAAEGRRGYARGKYVASFLGMVPADDPRLVILVVVDEPEGHAYYGGLVAAPVFKAIAEPVLAYLGLHPETERTVRVARVPSRGTVFGYPGGR